MSIQNQFEILEEQTRDALNVLQLLEVELSANEDDGHIIRTVSIVEKMLQEHLATLQQQFSYYGNTQQSISEP